MSNVCMSNIPMKTKAEAASADELGVIPEASTSGAAQPPAAPPPVALAEPAEAAVCPETNTVCTESCVLPAMTGRVYCGRWVRRIQAEELNRRSEKGK